MYTNKPNRLPGFDYSSGQFYFVTSVVKNRIPCFGQVQNDVMILNDYGNIALEQLQWLPKQYPYLELHHHIIMPDHVHAIIQIEPHGHTGKIKSLSELMGAFKTRSSKFIRLAGMEQFTWQSSFHDRIVRNTNELNRIANNINQNPERYGK